MNEHIYKSHNKTLLLYYSVFPANYRQKVFSKSVEINLKNICIEISKRYEIHFIEIGLEQDHVHFLVESVPTLTVFRIVTIIKSITARRIFQLHKDVKKDMWGGSLWASGYYANSVGQFTGVDVIRKYVANQGRNYKQIYSFVEYMTLRYEKVILLINTKTINCRLI